MFYDCTSLREFNVDMPPALTAAYHTFHGCKLNKASVQRIVDTIPTYTDGKARGITIGIDSTQITQAEQDAFNTTIVGKGWTTTWQRN